MHGKPITQGAVSPAQERETVLKARISGVASALRPRPGVWVRTGRGSIFRKDQEGV